VANLAWLAKRGQLPVASWLWLAGSATQWLKGWPIVMQWRRDESYRKESSS